MGLKSIHIVNFKSIRDSGEIEIKPLNILIGANGVGKSNFINFFKFLNNIYNQEIQLYVNKNGRANNFLHFGLKVSEKLAGKITFDNSYNNQYSFIMEPDQAGNLIFTKESSNFKYNTPDWNKSTISNSGALESSLKDSTSFRNNYLRLNMKSFKVFHFHDTSFSAKVKQPSITTDYAYFQENGGNIASFLYKLQEATPNHFKLIEKVIQSIAPFFDRFYLKPDEINPQQIYLRWFEKGSEELFSAHNFSDGTLRMICLTTLLMQPELPATIIIDEPELGLHPFAISKLAGMLKIASDSSQIIVSTQSVSLVNQFNANDVIVVDRKDNQSVFTRLSEDSLSDWLNDYTLGELWEKNVIGGRPN
jgi:predicted ATPase